MKLGDKLKNLREHYGYSQTQIANVLDTSQRNVSNYESTEEITGLLDYIFKFCRYFKIPVSEFFIENISDLKNTLPDYIKPEDAALIKIINTGVDIQTQIEIKKAFIQVARAILINKSDRIKDMPEYKELFGE